MLEFIFGAIVGHWIGKNVSVEINGSLLEKETGYIYNGFVSQSIFKDGKEINPLQEK